MKKAKVFAGGTHKSSYGPAVLRCGQIDFHSLTTDELLDLPKGPFRHVVTVNAEIFSYAHQNTKLMQVLTGTVNTIDGRVLQGICKLLYPREMVLRIVGADFIYDLASHCVKRFERLFLLGSSPEANSKAVKVLQDRFPGIQISGFAPPFEAYPFSESLNSAILRRIEAFRPNNLVVCFGPVKQEFWIHEHASQLAQIGVSWAYGLGATIDFVAGVRHRAPKWVQFAGFEWLFRLMCEPRARAGRTLEMFRMPYYVLRKKAGRWAG
jgi:N-acetylglucosaminyldiphosphoundecaprenol N-acetyl-beta-D-mannosaminyltransferase